MLRVLIPCLRQGTSVPARRTQGVRGAKEGVRGAKCAGGAKELLGCSAEMRSGREPEGGGGPGGGGSEFTIEVAKGQAQVANLS